MQEWFEFGGEGGCVLCGEDRGMVARGNENIQSAAGEVAPAQTRVVENLGAHGIVRCQELDHRRREIARNVLPQRQGSQLLVISWPSQGPRSGGGQRAYSAASVPAPNIAGESADMADGFRALRQYLTSSGCCQHSPRLRKVPSPAPDHFRISWRRHIKEHQPRDFL